MANSKPLAVVGVYVIFPISQVYTISRDLTWGCREPTNDREGAEEKEKKDMAEEELLPHYPSLTGAWVLDLSRFDTKFPNVNVRRLIISRRACIVNNVVQVEYISRTFGDSFEQHRPHDTGQTNRSVQWAHMGPV